MTLEVHNKGPGYFGKPEAGWNIILPATPYRMNMGAGPLGAVNFQTNCDWSVRFTIDNYLSVQHYMDDDSLTRGLSTFNARISGLNTDGEIAGISAVSPLTMLNREMRIPLMSVGTIMGTFALPVGEPYVLNGVDYLTGYAVQNINGVDTHVERPGDTYDIAAFGNRVWILAEGGVPANIATPVDAGHAIVYEHHSDGTFIRVWAVYSDADDIGANGAGASAIGVGQHSPVLDWPTIFVGQTDAVTSRVKQFDSTGNFKRQHGSTGLGAGQFQLVSGIWVEPNSSTKQTYWVADRSLGRLTQFNIVAGTVVTTHDDNADSNLVVSVAEDSGVVYAGSQSGKITVWAENPDNALMNIIGENNIPVAGYAKVQVDRLHHIYVLQDGVLHMLARRDTSFNNEDDFFYVGGWDGPEGAIDNIGAVDYWGGTGYWALPNGKIGTFMTLPTSLESFFLYYIASGNPNQRVRLLGMNNPFPYVNVWGDVVSTPGSRPTWAIGTFDGNLWERLCELCAVTENEILVIDDTVVVRARADRTFALPKSAIVSPMSLSNDRRVQRVEATSLNSKWNLAADNPLVYTPLPIYTALDDDNHIFSCDVGTYEVHTVEVNGEALYVTEVDLGTHIVAPDILSNGILVDNGRIPMDNFREAGGSVEAWPGEEPGTLDIAITGPKNPLANGLDEVMPGPYEFRIYGTTHAEMVIYGTAIIQNPSVVTVGTGAADTSSTSADVLELESPFFISPDLSGTHAVRAAYASSPTQELEVTMSAVEAPRFTATGEAFHGSHDYINSIFYYLDSEYIVTEVEQSEGTIVLRAERWNMSTHSIYSSGIADWQTSGIKRFEEIWKGTTHQQFEMFWSGYSSGEFDIAPLANPTWLYGHNY